MTGAERRQEIVRTLREATEPISGSDLGEKFGVSRQAIVQDIALIRAHKYNIVSTYRGYVLEETRDRVGRVYQVNHSDKDLKDELITIVDLGGSIIDVGIDHEVYGRISASLDIHSRRDVELFVETLKEKKAKPLKTITSGFHNHLIEAKDEETLDIIEQALLEKGYLVSQEEF